MDKLVTIVIPCYNRLDLLQRAIASLLANTSGLAELGTSYAILVVNDGSTEPEVKAWIDEQISMGVIQAAIHHETNQGVAASVNDGWHAARHSDYLVKFDSDMEVVDPTWLARLISAADAFPEVGVLGISVEPVVEPGQIHHRAGASVRVVRYNINGAVLMVRQETLEKLGYFYQFSRAYAHEDAEYSIRSQLAGMPIAYLPGRKQIFVKNRQPTQEGTYRDWKDQCSEENRPELMARIEAMRQDPSCCYHPWNHIGEA